MKESTMAFEALGGTSIHFTDNKSNAKDTPEPLDLDNWLGFIGPDRIYMSVSHMTPQRKLNVMREFGSSKENIDNTVLHWEEKNGRKLE